MSEVEVSIQNENKTQDESPSLAVVNNVSGNGGNIEKEEMKATSITPAKNEDPPKEIRSPEPASTVLLPTANDAVLDPISNKNEKPAPVKRTPSKRRSFVERAQRESEELVKNLGGSLDIEGGRKTRSSTRGTPSRTNAVATPPPAKKGRAATAASGTPRRGRGRKLDTSSSDVTDAIAENTVASPEEVNSVEKQEQPKDDKSAEKSKVNVANEKLEAENDKVEENQSTDVEMNDIPHSPKIPEFAASSNSNSLSHDLPSGKNNLTAINSNNGSSLKTPPAKAVIDVVAKVEEEQKKTATETTDIQTTIELMEVDGKPSVVNDEPTKPEENKVEKIDLETSSSSNAVINTSTTTTTTVAIRTTTVSNKTVEIVDSTGAALRTTNSIAMNNKLETSVGSTFATEENAVAVFNEDKSTVSVVDVPSLAKTPVVTVKATPTVVTGSSVDVSVPVTAVPVVEHKSENSDLCEPKLVSSPPPPQAPPISTTSETVATPQYCN